MLVLSRFRDESIFVGDDIKITIIDIRGDKVRVGISAPDHVSIDREEVRLRKIEDGVLRRPPQRLTFEDMDHADH